MSYVAHRLEKGRRIRATIAALNQLDMIVGNGNAVSLTPCPSLGVKDAQGGYDSFSLEPDRVQSDPLWLAGRGPKVLGQDVFFSPYRLEGIGDQPIFQDGMLVPRQKRSKFTADQVAEFWRLVERLPDLVSIYHCGDKDDALFASPSAARILSHMNRLTSLEIRGEVTDDFLLNFRPPPALRQLTLTGVRGGSRESWDAFYDAAKSQGVKLSTKGLR